MAKTGVKGISYDVRDSLFDAGFQYRGLRYRKKFKTLEKAVEWINRTRQEAVERIRQREVEQDLQRPFVFNNEE